MQTCRHKILPAAAVDDLADKAISDAFDKLKLVRVIPPVPRKLKKLLRRSFNTRFDACNPPLTKAQKQRLWLDFWWTNETRQAQFGCMDQMLAIEDDSALASLVSLGDKALATAFSEALR